MPRIEVNAAGLDRLALGLVLKEANADRAMIECEIIERLTSRLSIYKCPRRFVYLDDMPVTSTGKLQRYKVREIAAAQLQF